MINQAEGGALPLTCTPSTSSSSSSPSSCSVSRQVWLQPVTDAPHCQAAKDVLADAAARPACQAPGLQGSPGREGRRDRGREERKGGAERERERDRIWRGEEQVSDKKEKRGVTRDNQTLQRPWQAGELSDRRPGRAAARSYWSAELKWHMHSLTGGGILSPYSCTRCLDTRAYT